MNENVTGIISESQSAKAVFGSHEDTMLIENRNSINIILNAIRHPVRFNNKPDVKGRDIIQVVFDRPIMAESDLEGSKWVYSLWTAKKVADPEKEGEELGEELVIIQGSISGGAIGVDSAALIAINDELDFQYVGGGKIERQNAQYKIVEPLETATEFQSLLTDILSDIDQHGHHYQDDVSQKAA